MYSQTFRPAAIAAAAALILAPAAQAGVLVVGYSPNQTSGDIALVAGGDLTPLGVTQSVAGVPTGLAWGAGSLFVSAQDGGTSYLQRFNTSLQNTDTGTISSYQFGPLAHSGGTLYAGFDGFIDSGVLGVDNSLDFVPGTYVDLPEPSGLAFGDNSLFVAYGSVLSRYDTAGALLDTTDLSAFADFGPLTFGGGKLFAGLTVATFGGEAYGVAAFDPFDLSSMSLSLNLDSAALGLAYGDGGLFVSEAHSIAKYNPTNGDKTAFLDLGALYAGPLAFIPQDTRPEEPCRTRVCDPAGGVPEPGTWALMILGFGGAGVVLRQRRRLLSAAI